MVGGNLPQPLSPPKAAEVKEAGPGASPPSARPAGGHG